MEPTHRVVAGWVLHQRIGSGGFGEVWKARRRHVDLFRALKLVPVSSDHAFASWRHEISRLEELSHPNIVRFYDADIVTEDGPYRDCAWIATELCTRSLADELRRRPGHLLTMAEVVALLDAMLGALAAAHDGGCVHRDVKPGNILLHPSGAWKLCDFGTARLIPQGEDHPRTAIVGTFPYMSPAAHRGRQDQAADLYALGVTVHEALCGRRLHPRHQGMTDSEYVKLVLDTPPQISADLDPRWRTVVAALIGAYGDHTAGELHAWFHQTRGAFGPEARPHRGSNGPAPVTSSSGPTVIDGTGVGISTSTSTGGTDTSDTVTRRSGHPRPQAGERFPTPPQGIPVQPSRRERRRQRRHERRRAKAAHEGEHLTPILVLITVSLAVAAALLYAVVQSAVAVAAIVGGVLLFLLLVMALS